MGLSCSLNDHVGLLGGWKDIALELFPSRYGIVLIDSAERKEKGCGILSRTGISKQRRALDLLEGRNAAFPITRLDVNYSHNKRSRIQETH